MYEYFKIRLRIHKNRIKFYLLLLVCAFVGGNSAFCYFCHGYSNHYFHIRCLFCFVRRQASHIQFSTCFEILEPIKRSLRFILVSFARSEQASERASVRERKSFITVVHSYFYILSPFLNNSKQRS